MGYKFNYKEKLQHPLWQKKRLDILNRENFTCQKCGDKETNLHVHHKEYKSGKEPWEYEDENFECLCQHCHAITETYKEYDVMNIQKIKDSDGSNNFCALAMLENKEGYFIATGRHDGTNYLSTVIISRSVLNGIETLFNKIEKDL